MSRWSLYTWRRDGRSLRRAVPTLAVLAALLTTSAGVAGGAAGAVERDVLGSGGLTQNTAALLAAARAGRPSGDFPDREGAQSAVVVVEHQRQVAAVTKSLQNKGFSASAVSDRVRDLPGLFGAADLAMRLGVLVLALGALVLGAVRAGDSARARIGQFAILRILGAGRPELRRILLGEAMLSGGVAGSSACSSALCCPPRCCCPLPAWPSAPSSAAARPSAGTPTSRPERAADLRSVRDQHSISTRSALISTPSVLRRL
ncbi:hypothetical protein R5A26_19835 [Streptomyces prunicolor]|uniref:Uncharacterized protein n=2 Tax=Streptomyces prunicolor TaxID=67348 RepID=A0ABU4FC88_9ACTN|nr:hypothetical protein [Streptomyces prunicolor]